MIRTKIFAKCKTIILTFRLSFNKKQYLHVMRQWIVIGIDKRQIKFNSIK